MSGLFASYGATFLAETGARSSGLGVFVTETVRSGATVDLAGDLAPSVALAADLTFVQALAGDLAPSLALGAGLTVVPAPANYVDLAGNLGGASSYGVGGYGKGLYSRNGAITPAFAGNLEDRKSVV